MKLKIVIGIVLGLTIWLASTATLLQLGDAAFITDRFAAANKWYSWMGLVNPLVNMGQRNDAVRLATEERLAQVNSEEIGGVVMAKETQRSKVLGAKILIPVLMYHYIRVNPTAGDPVGYSLSVTPADFASQMNYLSQHGYQSMTLDQMGAALANKEPLPRKPVVITFDDGYADFYTQAYPILKSLGLKGLNFVITGLVGAPNYLTWNQITEMAGSGLITFGSHTVHHYALTYLNNQQVQLEVEQSKNVLQAHVGYPVNWFAYPYGNVNNRVEGIVRQAGYTGAFGTANGDYLSTDYMFTLPRVRVSGGESLATFASRLPWQ